MQTQNETVGAGLESKIDAHLARLVADGLDPSAITPDEISKIVKALDLTPEEIRYAGELGLERMVMVELGRQIVECIERHFGKVHRPDIAPCVTAYLEDLASQAEGGAQ